mgnify:CR=1 FL=1
MSYKVMGITAGRKNSNSEILLKEALLACQEAGAEVTMINLKDYHIRLIFRHLYSGNVTGKKCRLCSG